MRISRIVNGNGLRLHNFVKQREWLAHTVGGGGVSIRLGVTLPGWDEELGPSEGGGGLFMRIESSDGNCSRRNSDWGWRSLTES